MILLYNRLTELGIKNFQQQMVDSGEQSYCQPCPSYRWNLLRLLQPAPSDIEL